jgi:hypothetical protein
MSCPFCAYFFTRPFSADDFKDTYYGLGEDEVV